MISLVIGLGNVGPKYARTRHNLGFSVIDKLLQAPGAAKQTNLSSVDVFIKLLSDKEIVLAKPTTLVNLSGHAVSDLLDNFQLSIKDTLIVLDDFNLPLGQVRLRTSGSDGGHNGLRSIIQTLGHENFARLRLGIGPLPETISVVDFVLGRFLDSETENAAKMVDMAAQAVILATEHPLHKVMLQLNSNPAQPENH
ncbi:MAG: aminoacyl-tRNA hydrolase [candidate division Zixibacteria bacterium]|nr:aminoacyl-tRNA hydrolase [candidate division Zixibacteria bacterium]